MRRGALGCALVATLIGCGPGPKPAELVSFEQLRQADDAEIVQARQPELFTRAEKAYAAALEAWQDNEEDDARHHTRMATILWRTAVANSQRIDHEDAAKAAKNRQAAAEEELEAARRRKAAAEDALARQKRILEMQAQLSATARTARMERRAQQAKAKVDAAAAMLKEAERVEAATHAPGPFNKAAASLKLAFDAFNQGDFAAAEQRSDVALIDAQAAVAAAKPTFDEAEKARAVDRRYRLMMQSAATIPGSEARIERRGLVVIVRGLFRSGAARVAPGKDYPVQQIARMAQENPDFRVVVEGHTDNRGGSQANLRLSEKRAEAVVDALAAEGVDRSRMTALGKGDYEPIADNARREGRAQNRRVAVVFLRPTGG